MLGAVDAVEHVALESCMAEVAQRDAEARRPDVASSGSRGDDVVMQEVPETPAASSIGALGPQADNVQHFDLTYLAEGSRITDPAVAHLNLVPFGVGVGNVARAFVLVEG